MATLQNEGRTVANTLLILGNGFDLQCKLKTSYKNFFDYQSEKCEICGDFKRLVQTFFAEKGQFETRFKEFIFKYKTELQTEFSIWNLFFLGKAEQLQNPGWCDIEDEIYRSLCTSISRLKSPFWTDVYEKICETDISVTHNDFYISEPSLGYLIFMILKYQYSVDIHQYPIQFENWKISFLGGQEKWQFFLLDQLKKFEKTFSNYIHEALKLNPNYKKNAEELISRILPERNNANVLNFNYTRCFFEHSAFLVDNVHGSVVHMGKIIFGIDNNSATPNDFPYVFTKTYRKIEKFVLGNENRAIKMLSEEVNKIIFYGHSLNKQDYSYFQAIFDHYDLYNKTNIELEFCYTIYENGKEETIKAETIDRIVKMLDIYGNTLSNKDQGKNMTHKLLLEKRIRIREIDPIEDNDMEK